MALAPFKQVQAAVQALTDCWRILAGRMLERAAGHDVEITFNDWCLCPAALSSDPLRLAPKNIGARRFRGSGRARKDD